MTVLRKVLAASDPARVEAAARATGFFSAEENAIARELAEEALSQGEASGYQFILAEELGSGSARRGEAELLGFVCFGPIPATQASFDLYWIVVTPTAQRCGLGRTLLTAVEQAVCQQGGRQLYADTSSRAQYTPTRRFYERMGFEQVALLQDFYAEGDGKVIYCKLLAVAGSA